MNLRIYRGEGADRKPQTFTNVQNLELDFKKNMYFARVTSPSGALQNVEGELNELYKDPGAVPQNLFGEDSGTDAQSDMSNISAASGPGTLIDPTTIPTSGAEGNKNLKLDKLPIPGITVNPEPGPTPGSITASNRSGPHDKVLNEDQKGGGPVSDERMKGQSQTPSEPVKMKSVDSLVQTVPAEGEESKVEAAKSSAKPQTTEPKDAEKTKIPGDAGTKTFGTGTSSGPTTKK